MRKHQDLWRTVKFIFPLFVVLGVGIVQFQHGFGLGGHKVAGVPHNASLENFRQLLEYDVR